MDMTTLTPIIVQIIAGAVGGHAAGATLKDQSLGPIGNTVSGAVGGVGGSILASLIPALQAAGASNGVDLQHIAGGGIGGIILTIIVGVIKNSMAQKA